MGVWGGEDGGEPRDNGGAEKGPGAQTELHPRNQDPEVRHQHQRRHPDDAGNLPLGVLRVVISV